MHYQGSLILWSVPKIPPQATSFFQFMPWSRSVPYYTTYTPFALLSNATFCLWSRAIITMTPFLLPPSFQIFRPKIFALAPSSALLLLSCRLSRCFPLLLPFRSQFFPHSLLSLSVDLYRKVLSTYPFESLHEFQWILIYMGTNIILIILLTIFNVHNF